MCIALLSTAHPDYPLILLSNRDEFLNRPTAPADWWEEPNHHVLGGRDLQRKERGTWLGITKQGRLAVLTNFREEGVEVARDKSRGGIVNAYLTVSPDQAESDDSFARRLVEDVGVHDVGGFSLVFGSVKPTEFGSPHGLSILSNRTSSAEGMIKLATKEGETHGLSNSHYGDLTWPKVVYGEQLLKQAVKANIDRGDPEQYFIASLFDILSIDTLPRRKGGEDWTTYVRQMRNSVLIPPVGGEAVERKSGDKIASAKGTDTPDHSKVNVGGGIYGTQKQTVVLVDKTGHVKFMERTLYDEKAHPVDSKDGERTFAFEIEV